ncbi:MAG TPA: hypothetical protein VF730_11595 [Terracidiphilus sp.]
MYRLWVAIAAVACTLSAACASAQTPVYRKGVTLAGSLSQYTANNFAVLQQILNTGAGVIGFNLPWFAATQDCSDTSCQAQKPASPRNWDDPQYANSPTVQALDAISHYVAQHGNGAFMMVITFGTPGWAACPLDPTGAQQAYYPPQNAADYGDFMYAMSERYSGAHTNDAGTPIGAVKDWIVYNEVNSPAWWKSTACNTQDLDPAYYYGGILNAAYTAVHHLPASSGVRVLAGAFTSYDHVDYQGDPGLRISTSYSDWQTNTANGDANSAWISPTDFVQAMHDYGEQFDAIALHPYAPEIYGDPLAQPPSGAISLGNIGTLLSQLETLYPNGQNQQWHVALTEYMQQSYYDPTSAGWDHVSAVPCPNYFCAQTTELNMSSFLQNAYGTSGSDRPYVDYLVWAMWNNINPYVGGLVRADGSDKNEGLGSGSVRQTFTAIQP